MTIYDLNQSSDVIDQMRDGDMSDEQITKVCREVIAQLAPNDMKLWEIGWETDEGRELIETVAAPEMTKEIATKYILDTYRELWSDPDMSEDEVYNVYLSEFHIVGVIGSDKQCDIVLRERVTPVSFDVRQEQ